MSRYGHGSTSLISGSRPAAVRGPAPKPPPFGPVQKIPKLTENDIVISVMGVTGSGKSTFISHFSDKAKIGYGLESMTQAVEIIPCKLGNGTDFYLVDTPGFDDTHRSDSDVLSTIADWLSSAYSSNVNLTGIIYLHRILDPRIGGVAMKNLKMFKKLVGEKGFGSVVLATTMWEGVPIKTGELRENDLKTQSDFWKHLLEQGAKLFRQDSGPESALRIVKYLIDRDLKIVTDLQTDMVDRKMRLNDTAAGKEVVSEMNALRAEYEQKLADLQSDLMKATAEKDKEQMEIVEELKAEYQKKISNQDTEMEKLRVDRQELRRMKEAQYAKEVAELKAQILEAQILEAQSLKEARGLKQAQLQAEKYRARYYQARLAARCTLM